MIEEKNMLDHQDITKIDMITMSARLKYADIGSILTNPYAGMQVFVCIDLMDIILELEALRDEMCTVKKDEEYFYLHSVIAILNTLAHYKHYFKLKQAMQVCIIGYCPNEKFFTEHQKLMDMLKVMAYYFKDIYITEPVFTNKYTPFTIEAYGIMKYLKLTAPSDSHSAIIVVSKHLIGRQLLCSLPSRFSAYMYKSYSGIQIVTKEEMMNKITKGGYDDFPYKFELEFDNVLVGKCLGTYVMGKGKDDIKIEYAIKKKDILKYLNDKYSTQTSRNDVISGLCKTTEDARALNNYLLKYDVNYKNDSELVNIVGQLVRSIRTKVSDSSFDTASEHIKMLTEHPLSVNWLR